MRRPSQTLDPGGACGEDTQNAGRGMSGLGKVVVNRAMSLDGFIAGPGHAMDWGGDRALADFVAPDDVLRVAALTGAMLIGRRTYDVGARMAGGRNLEVLGADVAGQCLRAGLTRSWCTSCRSCLATASASHPRGVGRVELDPVISARSGEAIILRFQVRPGGAPQSRRRY